MRRSSLPPPRNIVTELGPAARPGSEPEPRHVALDVPSPARPRLRHLFNPVTGWFRRIERSTNRALSSHVWPRIPGATLPYAVQIRRQLTVVEARLEVPGLPPAFGGTRVLLICDVHGGPFLAPVALERTIERLMLLEPDLILAGGDFITSRLSDWDGIESAMRALRAPLGIVGVLGNHDHYPGEPERLRRRLERAGIRVLHNEAAVVERGGERLAVAGIDDLILGRPDLEAALASAPPGMAAILLSHNPDVFFDAASRGVRLVLSGHTHGGQIRIPGLPVLVRMSRYRLDEGRYALGRAQLVVSRGLGVTGLPLRIACAPEAVLLELYPAARGEG